MWHDALTHHSIQESYEVKSSNEMEQVLSK